MIWSVMQRGAPGYAAVILGIVNEHTVEDAEREARRIYGRYWCRVAKRMFTRTVYVAPTATQGMH